MPEFDLPGHAWAWGIGYPDILPANYQSSPNCYNVCPNNPCDVPLDPSTELTFKIIDGLFGELTGKQEGQGIFFEDFMHLGGDEVFYGCWNQSARIVNFMQQKGFDTFEELYGYFVNRSAQIARKYGRTPVNWEEVFIHFGDTLPKDTIIHVWLDAATVKSAVTAGFRVLLSNGIWYLDHLGNDWTQYYFNDPLFNITNPNQAALILGGEACMWGETVDSSDIFQRIWPKASAFAERLWNYNIANLDFAAELAIPRLHKFRCSMLERGIGAAPLYSYFPREPESCYSS